MAIPTVYRSTDPGAPTMNRAIAGSAIAVLRACLVTGYGDKPPAGWTEPFSDASQSAFQNQVAAGATGCFVRITDATASSIGAITIQTFRDMSAIGTGDDPTFMSYGYKSPGGSSSDTPWIIVATGTAFWMSMGDGDRIALVAGGDIISQSESDAYRYFCLGFYSSENSLYPPPCLGYSGGGSGGPYSGWGTSMALQTGLHIGRLHTGLGGAVGAGIIKPWGGGSSNYIGGDFFPALPSENAADAARMPAMIIHGSGASAVIRGRLPGCSIPLFNVTDLAAGAPDPSGSSGIIMPLRGGSPRFGGVIVSTDDWDD